MLIKVCADSIVIREGGGSIFLRERQCWGGHLEKKGEPPSAPPTIPVHCSPTYPHSLPCFSLCISSVFLRCSLYLPVSLPSLWPCQSLVSEFLGLFMISCQKAVSPGCSHLLLMGNIRVCLGVVCKDTCVLGCVCGHVCMSEVTCVSELVCARVYLSPGASVRTPDCWGLCVDTCQGSYAHRYA